MVGTLEDSQLVQDNLWAQDTLGNHSYHNHSQGKVQNDLHIAVMSSLHHKINHHGDKLKPLNVHCKQMIVQSEEHVVYCHWICMSILTPSHPQYHAYITVLPW